MDLGFKIQLTFLKVNKNDFVCQNILMKRIILIILDGWGWSKEKNGNAILAADTPNMDYLKRNYPLFLIQASGLAVGLPPLKEGDSEVGHMTIGAGRIIIQHLTLIDGSIKNGSFFRNEIFIRLLEHVKKNKSKLHLIGLLTSGTVHASLGHLISIIKFLRRGSSNKILLHLFSDGKDSGKKESLNLIAKVEREIAGSEIKIASLVGRDFAMDRESNWGMTQKAYNLLAFGLGEKTENLKETIESHFSHGITDELIPPILNLTDFAAPINPIVEDGDGILFLNFREDSIRQLARALSNPDFDFFETKKFKNLFLAAMTDYGAGIKVKPIFKREEIKNTLGEVLEQNGLSQLRIAETAKSAHLTYFFNGLREKKFENETDFIIPSSEDFLQNPEMKAGQIAQKIIEEAEKGSYQFIAANFANPDILSHSGDYEATVRGVEAVDRAIGAIYKAGQNGEGAILMAGDHGNAENLVYLGTGEKESRHNPNPVPFLIVGKKFKKEKTAGDLGREESEIKGTLQDVAPTILNLMDIEKPGEMTGINLI
ncbi:MAG: 2,3-bisphosphoglycerate-independent phosphoglycerate mutase [Parcubacteria group bacterium]|nr:2,3-bisphosphoglycerate-independent phosphoglycerate mutase [Parcubacteria group bacterium]